MGLERKNIKTFDPFEGTVQGTDDNGNMVFQDAGGNPVKHKMCGNSPIPVIGMVDYS